MLPARHMTALVLLFVSLIGVLTVSYYQILDMDRLLVREGECKDVCKFRFGNRCLLCENYEDIKFRFKRSPATTQTVKQPDAESLKDGFVQHKHDDNTFRQIISQGDGQVHYQHHHQHQLSQQQQYQQQQAQVQQQLQYQQQQAQVQQQLQYQQQQAQQQKQLKYPPYQSNMQGNEEDEIEYQPGNKCVQLTACLRQCKDGLINVCAKQDIDRQFIDVTDSEPLCEEERPLVMGHAGGDTVSKCENTPQATLSGIQEGMEAVHIDISVSKDMVPFLWRDHDPRSLSSRLRQLGIYGTMGCRPGMVPETLKPAHTLDFDSIQSSWFYLNTTSGLPADHVISFKEWIEEVGPAIKSLSSIWLEFRMPKEFLESSISVVWSEAESLGIEEKLFFKLQQNGKINFHHPITMVGGVDISVDQLSTSQWNSLVYLLEEVQTADQNDNTFILNREDEVVYALLVERITAKPSFLTEEIKSLLDPGLLNLNGINFEVKTMDDLVENVGEVIRSRDNVTRDTCQPQYTQVAAWTVNSLDISNKLVCLRTDYIITDFPGRINRNVRCESDVKLIEQVIEQDPTCPLYCARIYEPVCGSDGVTHSNKCMLRLAECESGVAIKILHSGKCRSADLKKERTRQQSTTSTNVQYGTTTNDRYAATQTTNAQYPTSTNVKYHVPTNAEYPATKNVKYTSSQTTNDRYSATANDRYSATTNVKYTSTQATNDRYSATSNDRYSTTANDRYSATANDRYSATANDRYSATANDRYSTTTNVKYPSMTNAQISVRTTSQNSDTTTNAQNTKTTNFKHDNEVASFEKISGRTYRMNDEPGHKYINRYHPESESSEDDTFQLLNELDSKIVCDASYCIGEEDYSPVCGEDNLTYDSMCHLAKTRCTAKPVEIQSTGACHPDPCRNPCSNLENPVCASDRRSYMNLCELERSACLDRKDGGQLYLWHRGKCGDCNIVCTREFTPVCGSDGVTYPNQCVLEAQTCKINYPTRKVHNGMCKGSDVEDDIKIIFDKLSF